MKNFFTYVVELLDTNKVVENKETVVHGGRASWTSALAKGIPRRRY